jgi:hypothetical protein
MAFFSRFFGSTQRTPLPTLDELLQARGLSPDLPGLEPHLGVFEGMNAQERVHWADALAHLQAKGWPLPPAWLDAQYELLPRLVPTWMAERDGTFYRPHLDGLSLRVDVAGQPMPEAWLHLWGLPWEEVHDRALEHLRESSKDQPFHRLSSGIYQADFREGSNASRLLLPDLWKDLFPGQNTFLAVPAEDTFLVAPQVLLPKLVEAIGRAVAGPSPRLMATIFQLVGDQMLPANLQDPHPMAQPQRELRQSDLMEAYRAQDEALPADLGRPAPMGILRTQQGRSVSFCTWMEGGPMLLPETDLVGFVDREGRPLGLYFRQTLPRIPELHGTPLDIWGPRRLRFEGFPTAEQLERLECFATAAQMAGIFKGPSSSRGPALPPPNPAASGALAAQASSPVPAHLRGLSLGVQDRD